MIDLHIWFRTRCLLLQRISDCIALRGTWDAFSHYNSDRGLDDYSYNGSLCLKLKVSYWLHQRKSRTAHRTDSSHWCCLNVPYWRFDLRSDRYPLSDLGHFWRFSNVLWASEQSLDVHKQRWMLLVRSFFLDRDCDPRETLPACVSTLLRILALDDSKLETSISFLD